MTERTINSTCGYCSTGCNLSVHLTESIVDRVTATANYPVNLGKACPKGFQFLGHLNATARATTPLLRDGHGDLQPVDWETALQIFVDRFKRLQNQHGKESVAFINTGQVTNEEFAFLGALAKFGMGMVHGDGNTRQCMATAAVAYKESFGFDAPPFTYKDFEESDVMIFIGSNPAIAHPIMWNRVKMNKHQPRIIVLDPRKTETATGPGIEHFAIRPKSDLSLLYGLANLLIERDWVNIEYIGKHTTGFAEFKAHVRQFCASRVSLETGLSETQVYALAELVHAGQRVSFWWMVGINQGHQAVRTAQGIINLALLTGSIGRPGTGANSITGQCNAMGSRLFANTASLFCGRDFTKPEHRQEVARILNVDVGLIPARPSLTYEKILEAVDAGQIKGLWIVCTNPVHSWIDRNRFRQILAKAEFIVVQDMFPDTETARYAHLILPAAGCGEKEGTLINSERRIGLVQKIVEPPGQAWPDFEIFRQVARYWGCESLFREWTSPAAVFQILKKLSKGRPCDFSGVSDYRMLDEAGGVQWPFSEADDLSDKERRLFEHGTFYHPDGKARFIFEDIVEPAERPSTEYPFVLLTGRGSVAQWHTLTRTDRAPILKRMSPDPAYVEINPDDAARLGIQANDWLIVYTKKAEAAARARISPGMQAGHLFMPMHYDQTNNLTFPAFDTYSRQPSFKYSAVNVRKMG